MRGLAAFMFSVCVLLSSAALAASEDVVKIGGAFALTGSGAAFGDGELKAARMAVEDINEHAPTGGRRVELVVEDTKSTQAGTVTAVRKLLTVDKVRVVVGPTWLDSFQAALPIIEEQGAVAVTPSAVPEVYKAQAGKYPQVFSTFFNMKKELSFLLAEASGGHKKRVALLFDEDPFFQWVRQALVAEIKAKGLDLVSDTAVPVGTSDVRATMERLRTADFVICGFMEGATWVAAFKARKALDIRAPFYGTHDVEGYAADPAYADLLRGVFYAAPTAAEPDFIARFKARYGETPKLTASNAYDALTLVATPLVSGTPSAAALAELLRSREIKTVTFGPTHFDPFGGIEAGLFELRNIPDS